jgi:RNA polymerase sigma factor (sigma-70 family)
VVDDPRAAAIKRSRVVSWVKPVAGLRRLLHMGDDWSDAVHVERSTRTAASFDALFDRHARAVYRFAARRLGASAAEDVVAESFARAFAGRDRIVCTDAGSALPWLLGIANNVIRAERRNEERMLRAYARSGVDPAEIPHAARIEALDAEASWPSVAEALAELRLAEREALILFAWAELSYAEIAIALDTPIGTVRTLIHRARARLQHRLANKEATHAGP